MGYYQYVVGAALCSLDLERQHRRYQRLMQLVPQELPEQLAQMVQPELALRAQLDEVKIGQSEFQVERGFPHQVGLLRHQSALE